MTQVYLLTEEGHELVDEEFVRGNRSLTEEEVENARREAEFNLESDAWDLTGLREKMKAVMGKETVEFDDVTINGAEYQPGDASLDATLAPEVRKHLDLTREQAAHDGLWRYLAVVEFPEFVRYRWPYPDPRSNRSLESAKEKFLKHARDLYGNALVRLWWMAELTRDEDDYSLTRSALESQELANDVFDRGYARYPPAVRAAVDELSDADSRVISETTTKLNHALSTIRLETLSEDDLREIVIKIREKVEK